MFDQRFLPPFWIFLTIHQNFNFFLHYRATLQRNNVDIEPLQFSERKTAAVRNRREKYGALNRVINDECPSVCLLFAACQLGESLLRSQSEGFRNWRHLIKNSAAAIVCGRSARPLFARPLISKMVIRKIESEMNAGVLKKREVPS